MESDPVLPLPGHTIYPTPECEVAEFMSKREKQTVRIPLCHMEYCKGTDGVWAFTETSPLASPQLKISFKLRVDTYETMSLPVRTDGHSEKGVDTSEVADTGAQMDICSVSTVRSMGLDTTSLLPVKARVFGASKDAELNILGGILLEVRPPSLLQDQVLSTVRLFYVASNVTKTYLSLGTLHVRRSYSWHLSNIIAVTQRPWSDRLGKIGKLTAKTLNIDTLFRKLLKMQ